jgi:hypothetical protein
MGDLTKTVQQTFQNQASSKDKGKYIFRDGLGLYAIDEILNYIFFIRLSKTIAARTW